MSWTSVALGEICSPKQHKTIPTSVLLPDGYPVFGANGQIGFYSEYTHAEETVAITCRGATCGTINVAPAKSYITGNAMALDKLDRARVDLRFFVYALRHRGMHDVISGSAQPQITRAPLLDITIPLPPLDEQKRIAAILDQADELRRKRQLAIDRLNQLGQAIFYEMFGDATTNPMGWPTKPLGELAANEDGKRIPVKMSDRANVEGTYPYYGASGIIDYVDGFIFNGERLLIGEDGANLLSRSSPLAFIARGKYWVNNHAHVLAFNSMAYLRYLEFFIESIDVSRYVSGSAQPKITQKQLNSIEVPCPPMVLQERFSETIDELDKQSARMAASYELNNQMFSSIQHRAFQGEL